MYHKKRAEVFCLPKKEKIVFRGKEYNSLSHLARLFGVDPSVLRGRLNNGYTLEEALDKDFSFRHRKLGNKYVVEGHQYSSLSELAHDMFLDVNVLRARLRKGYTVEEAIDPDFNLKYDKRTSCSKRSNVSKLARENNVNTNTLRARLKLGYTIEQAIDPLFKEKYDKRGAGNNKRVSISKIARDNKMSVNTLSYRLKQGFPLDEALDPDFRERNKGVGSFKGLNLVKLSKDTGINIYTLKYRLMRGYTIEQATDRDFRLKYAWKKNNSKEKTNV